MLFGRAEAARFHATRKLWCGSREIDEAACLALHRLWSLTAAPTVVQDADALKWNSIGLITSQGSLGAYLTCLLQKQTFLFRILFLPDTRFSGFSVFLSMLGSRGGCGGVCTWSGRASDTGKPDNNNAIKFCLTGIACFAWAFGYPAD